MADIAPEVLDALNRGTREATTLVESLALDMQQLMQHVAPCVPQADRASLAGLGVKQRMERAGALLLEHYGAASFREFSRHASDTVRGWAGYLLGRQSELSLAMVLEGIRPLADDSNSGVREWAWMAVRQRIAAELEPALRHLEPWTAEPSANLRRFAVEATRPRGVWCAHLEALKQQPQLGLPLLEPLKADAAKYVNDSVSNWLNDAAKSQPAWVRELCARWREESASPHTARICTRALRSIGPG